MVNGRRKKETGKHNSRTKHFDDLNSIIPKQMSMVKLLKFFSIVYIFFRQQCLKLVLPKIVRQDGWHKKIFGTQTMINQHKYSHQTQRIRMN
jgi:hypothetical protein